MASRPDGQPATATALVGGAAAGDFQEWRSGSGFSDVSLQSSTNTDGSSSDAGGEGRIVLPRNFEDCALEHVVVLIADMLDRLTTINDQITVSQPNLTRFHSRTPPSISIHDYLNRIVQYTKPERSCLLLTLHYVDLICAQNPSFALSSLTVHRFLIASVTCSSKALCDVFCKNTHYARVGGLSLAELNLLEREFLGAIGWRLATTRELIQQYYTNLVSAHPSFKLAPVPSSSSSEAGSGTDSSSGSISDIEMDVRSASGSAAGDRTRQVTRSHLYLHPGAQAAGVRGFQQPQPQGRHG